MYLKERETVEKDINDKIYERDKAANENDEPKNTVNSIEQFINSFKQFDLSNELTTEVINKLVDAVYVFDENRIEICFSFKDELEKVILALNQFQKN